MVGNIKQIVSSLSVLILVFYFKGVMYQTFYGTFVLCTGSGKSRIVIEIPWKIFLKNVYESWLCFYVFKWFSCQIYNRLGQTLFVVHTFEIHHKHEEYHDVKMAYLVVEGEKEKSTSKNANERLKSGYAVFRTCWASISRKSFRI